MLIPRSYSVVISGGSNLQNNVFRTLLIKTGGSHVRKHMETSQ